MKRLTKKKKEEFVEEISKEISQNNLNLIVGFTGLSVPELQQIREELKEQGCKIQVVKNTLLERVYRKINYEKMCEYIQGPVFIVWTNVNDEIGIIKKIYGFQRQFGKIDVKAGLIRNELLTPKELALIEKLPGKKEIEAKVVLSLRMPMIRIVNALNFSILRVINNLKQIMEKRKERENGKD